MKTLIFENRDRSIQTTVKVDIFATNVEMVTPGFETRFTNMYIVSDDASIMAGASVKETEFSLSEAKALANSRTGVGLFAYDDLYPDVPAVVQVDTVTLVGTNGNFTLTVDGEDYTQTFATSLTATATAFVAAHGTAIGNDTGATVAAVGETLVFTAATEGTPFDTSIGTLTGDMAPTLTNTAINQDGKGRLTIVPVGHPVTA